MHRSFISINHNKIFVTGLNVEVVIGGLSFHEDVTKLKNNVHILVGSPGRLRHLIQANHIDVTAVRLLVLDEADKLMDKSFQADINYIFSVLPKEKQVIMSSATYPELLKSVMSKYVQNGQHICPDSTAVLLGIKQLVSVVKSNSNIVRQTQNRFDELLKILSKKNFKQCLIFCNYQVRVRDLYKMLQREKWPAEKLHGQQEQTDRLDALKMLQDYKCRILISTDLAARGIDASNIDLVINFEPPYEWQTYLHRIGRAGRFGSYGIAVTILSEGHEETKFKRMVKCMNELLVLKNFWDEENFYLNECDSNKAPLLHQHIENNEAYHELIDLLTNGDCAVKECADGAESFEALCNSFEKTKESEIESFNDLLTCFKSHKENASDLSYNNLNTVSNTDSEPILNMLNNVPLKLNINTELESNLNKLREEIKLLNTNQNLKKRGKPDKAYKPNYESLNKTLKKVAPETKLATNVNNEFYDDESALNKALLDAGLPTSFQSTKGSNNIKPKKSHYSSQKSNNFRYKEVANKIKPPLRERKVYNKQESGKNASETESSSSESIIKDNTNKLTYTNSKKNNYYNNQTKRYSQVNGHEVGSTLDNYTKYAVWYNQLKNHIEQIQMALYIEELSKM